MGKIISWFASIFNRTAKVVTPVVETTSTASHAVPAAGEAAHVLNLTLNTTSHVVTPAAKAATSTLGKAVRVGTGAAVVGTGAYAGTSYISSQINEATESKKAREEYMEKLIAEGMTAEQVNEGMAKYDEREKIKKENPSMASWFAIQDFFSDRKSFGAGSVIGAGAAGVAGFFFGESWLIGPAMIAGGLIGQPLLNAVTGGATAVAPKTPSSATVAQGPAVAPAQSLAVVMPKVPQQAPAAGTARAPQ